VRELADSQIVAQLKQRSAQPLHIAAAKEDEATVSMPDADTSICGEYL
jgi:hypothetical protein